MTGKLLAMQKPIPDSEADRLSEAVDLLMKLKDEDMPKLTTWEVELIESLREGKAATRLRLKELRDAIKRLYPDT